MDIEMIRFTGLLSIFLILGWLLIILFCIAIGGNMNKTDEKKAKDEKQSKFLEKYKNEVNSKNEKSSM